MIILKFPYTPEKTSVEYHSLQNIFQKIILLSNQLKSLPTTHLEFKDFFHQNMLQSSLFSAKIEGNQTSLKQAQEIIKTQNLDPNKQKLEIVNNFEALKKIKTLPEKIDKKNLLEIHHQILQKISNHAGKFRNESSAIYDGFGNIIYITPEPESVQKMLDILLDSINKIQAPIDQLITTAGCHYYFEKIHPFIDGNGRTGRVLMHYQLQKTELFADYILPIDKYFLENRPEYYASLEKNTRNIQNFLLFFFKGVEITLTELLNNIENRHQTTTTKKTNTQINLLPRRQEIFNIIKDHPYISLDSIARRFYQVPRRTIAHDVNQLVRKNLIKKYGETRGVRYGV